MALKIVFYTIGSMRLCQVNVERRSNVLGNNMAFRADSQSRQHEDF